MSDTESSFSISTASTEDEFYEGLMKKINDEHICGCVYTNNGVNKVVYDEFCKFEKVFINNEFKEIKYNKNCKSLKYSYCGLKNINNLNKELKLLSLGNNKIKKIKNIPKNMEYLNLSYNEIENIENIPLNMEYLFFGYNEISIVPDLSKLKYLTVLKLESNNITEIKSLPNNLKILNLDNNRLDLNGFCEVPLSVKYLSLDHNCFDSIPKNDAEVLSVQCCIIQEIENISEKIIKLNLCNNEIKEIRNLKNKKDLMCLNLSSNNISKITNIPKNIIELDLSCNNIFEINDIPHSVRSLDLNSNVIKEIKNIPYNVHDLNLSYNEITKIQNIKFLPKLEELTLYDNKITKLENIPESVERLYIDNNYITKIENIPEECFHLHLSDNYIDKIENIPDGLGQLILKNNKISKLENLSYSCYMLDVSNNKITEIPFSIMEQGRLEHFKYENNPIDHIPTPIKRWLDGLRDKLEVYDDDENVHNVHIQKCLKQCIENLLKDKPKHLLENCHKFINESNLTKETKKLINNHCKDKEVHSIYKINFEDILHLVINRIIDHPNKDNILEILDHEMISSDDKCFMGRIGRLINSLNGSCDDIKIEISENEQISNVVITMKKKFEGQELKEHIIKEMKEREIPLEKVTCWLDEID